MLINIGLLLTTITIFLGGIEIALRVTGIGSTKKKPILGWDTVHPSANATKEVATVLQNFLRDQKLITD